MGLAPLFVSVPSVLYLRGYVPSSSVFESLVRWWLVLSPTKVISVSSESLETLLEGLPRWLQIVGRRKAEVIYNWLEDSEDTVRTRTLHETPRIGTLSNVVPRKGIHHLLEVLERLRSQGLNAELWVAGAIYDRQYYHGLLERVRSHGLEDRVKFLGFIPSRDLLSRIDIFVLASDREGMPMAILEAMRAGVPVVAFAAEGVAEALDDGRAGVAVPVGDVDSLASAVAYLVRSPALRSELADRGRERSRVFVREVQVSRLLGVLRGMVARSRVARARTRP